MTVHTLHEMAFHDIATLRAHGQLIDAISEANDSSLYLMYEQITINADIQIIDGSCFEAGRKTRALQIIQSVACFRQR
jgi:hypothetical protein